MKSQERSANNGINIYIQNCEDMVRLLISEDRDLFDKLSDNEQQRLKELNKLDKNSPYYNFLRAEIKMQWAMVKLKFGKEFAAITSGLNAYKLLKKNEENFPDFLPHRKTLGAAKVLLGALPAKHRRYTSLVGLKGDVPEGLADIQSLIDSDSPFALEAKMAYFWLQTYVLGESKQAFENMQKLIKEHPDNLLLHISAAIIARNAGQSRAGYELLKRCPAGNDYVALHFLEYVKAELALQMGNYYASIAHGKAFIKNYKGESYIKSSYYRLFLAYWFLEDSRAYSYLEKVKTAGKNLVIPDEYAEKFAQKELPNRIITQARIFTDGGELAKASKLLNQLDPEQLPRKRDQLEYYYRKARLLHKKEQWYEAVLVYKQALSQTRKDSPYYFGANTALQLGYIYRDQFSDNKSAMYYFNLAMEFEEHEYKGGIDNKAKAALNRLRKKK
ncbi:MAG: hypothetical protein ACPGJS_15990 [Flammeovirgaceae bacterium]